MKILGKRYKIRRGENVVINYKVYTDADATSPYIIPQINNPYIVFNIKSNYYINDDFYVLNIWVPVYSGQALDFNISIPTYVTKHWNEQQYMLSINLVGGVSNIVTLQGLFKSVYQDDWRYQDDEIPNDYDTLYKMIQFKRPALLKGITNKPLSNISYNESLVTDRTVLVGD